MAVVISSGTSTVSKGATLYQPDILSSGVVIVLNSGTVSSAVIHNGGKEYVSSGGVDYNARISSGGGMIVQSSGTIYNAYVAGQAGITVYGGRVFSAVVGTKGTLEASGYSGGPMGYVSGGSITGGGNMVLGYNAVGSAIALNSGYIFVSSGGLLQGAQIGGVGGADTVAETVIKAGGSGQGNNIGFNGFFIVSSAATAKTTTVTSGGSVVASSGAILTWAYGSGGLIDVKPGASAVSASATSGLFRVSGIALDTLIESTGSMTVMSGGVARGSNRMKDGRLYINSGGFASAFTVSGGSVIIQGIAAGNTYNAGYILVSGGRTTDDNLLGGIMDIKGASGGSSAVRGFASNLTISNASAVLSSGAGIDRAEVNSGGTLYLYDTARLVNVGIGGVVRVENGGLHNSGTVSGTGMVKAGGTASGVDIGTGGVMTVESGGIHAFGKVYGSESVSFGGKVSGIEVQSGGSLSLNGSADNCVVSYGGFVYVRSGGFFNSGKASSNTHLTLSAGGTAILIEADGASTNIYGGSMFVSTGKLNSANISGGALELLSGACYSSARIDTGYVCVSSNCIASRTKIMNDPIDDPDPVHFISGYAEMLVLKGGKAINGTVDGSRSYLQVNSGGTATDMLITHSASVLVGGVIDAFRVQSDGAIEVVSSGAVASRTIIRNMGTMAVYKGGSAYDTTVSSGGLMRLNSQGSATLVTISSGGSVKVLSNCRINSCTVEAGGGLEISSGGLYSNVGVLSGGRIAGEFNCSSVAFSSGAIVDFNISELHDPNTTALVRNLSDAMSKVSFTLTASVAQGRRNYLLADGATGFNKTISVVNSGGEALGTLTVGQTVNIGNSGYTLKLTNDVLSVTVGLPGPDPGPEPQPAFTAKSDIDGNGVSDVMFIWTGEHGEGNYQHGYWMNDTSEWQSANTSHPAEWENLGCYDMNDNGKADSVLVGNVEVGGVKGAYIGYYLDSVDNDANWQNIGYLNNADNIAWQNKVGNITGNAGKNSIVWYAPELYALGVWKDGKEDWATLSSSFGGDDWTLVGCGDFDGDGADSVLMSGNNGQYFYAVGIDGTATALGSTNWSGWDVRAIGDFSGDTKDDLVLFHNGTGAMVLCANGNLDSYTSIGQLDASDWFVVGAGDYNGDQKDDLLVRQYSTGMLGYYSAGDTAQWVELGRGVDMNWTVIA